MAYSSTIMGGGVSAGTALALAGGAATALTAAGTTTTDALALGALDAHLIGTCASGAGVRVHAGAPGDSCWIYNGGANQCLVYPPTSAKFNSLATDGAFILPINTVATIKIVSATQAIVNLSA